MADLYEDIMVTAARLAAIVGRKPTTLILHPRDLRAISRLHDRVKYMPPFATLEQLASRMFDMEVVVDPRSTAIRVCFAESVYLSEPGYG